MITVLTSCGVKYILDADYNVVAEKFNMPMPLADIVLDGWLKSGQQIMIPFANICAVIDGEV